ncbi:pyrimidine-nucleoside phosphorylase [Anaeromassilibacillus sp. An200]|uniref:pyrimidine-nucleoside phosphorylase n=1 Tax=Anaeromassilibacillus sp. An200 TaxID=1965587 RepID=UPI0019D30C75|nr:pyrimidine-nucleoside phosphorylase [Anaeromassilibacillus sp. An200]
MRMYDVIAKKRDGGELTREEIAYFIHGYVKGEIPDYQASALAMAVYLRGMTARETAWLTMEMEHSGDTVDLSSVEGIKADKHSTGGVGDKTTFVLAPIVASLGVRMAKMSGRGLGHTGGTIDKLESIPGLRTDLSRDEFLGIVRDIGLCIVAQSGNLVPADKKLYALRDVTATVESVPLIASSIMSKKLAAGADCILLDVKTGSGAFMKTLEESRVLAKAMVEIASHAGRRAAALITEMDRPLGCAVGNALEVMEACETLQGRGPDDLTELCLELAAGILVMAGKAENLEQAGRLAHGQIANGQAFEKFRQMVQAQGGDVSALTDYDALLAPVVRYEVRARQEGFLQSLNTEQCGIASVALGAGREKKEDAIDYSAGILLKKKPGDFVHAGDVLAEFHAASEKLCHDAEEIFQNALQYGKEAPHLRPLILDRIGF